mmetsp:Transcript_96242/g.190710  ORF Transcript_96242/g.190710 Transcript_96242/m.190710 type:complete len:176 (-) Transcript_96242:7-534(-)
MRSQSRLRLRSQPSTSKQIRRRGKIFREDLLRVGYTAGCRGCTAAKAGEKAISHEDHCRARVAQEMKRLNLPGVQRLSEGDRRVTDHKRLKAGGKRDLDDDFPTTAVSAAAVGSASNALAVGSRTAQMRLPPQRILPAEPQKRCFTSPPPLPTPPLQPRQPRLIVLAGRGVQNCE